MKKLLLLLAVLILAGGMVFAQDEGDAAPAGEKPELFDLEVSAGFPVHWTNSEHDNTGVLREDKSVTANTALGVALLFNFTRKVGLTLDADFFFGGKLAGISSPSSDHNSLFGVNALLGPVIYIYNGSFLRVPLALGVHVYYFSDDLWIPQVSAGTDVWLKRRDLQFGPGAYIGVQFHFNNNIYIFSRTSVAVDVLRWHQEKGYIGGVEIDESEFELAFGWEIKPAIGLGIKF
ncbi:MAG: hypothetical protein LBK77_03995 [Spirochaetaceae bacterium]|jgi:hypothetical protein|nr:hypothetical protein [Spirochaetaceae bacterium]